MAIPTMKARHVAGSFIASGTVHMIKPEVFEPIMPRFIPKEWRKPLIYLSGIAELVCAVGLFTRAGWARKASAALLIAVFPANVQMAVDAGSGRNFKGADSRIVAWLRLPLQIPMIHAVLKESPSGKGS